MVRVEDEQAVKAMTEFSELVRALGLPGALLFIVGIVMWRVAKWAKPWGEEIVKSHLAFVRATSASMDANAARLERTFAALERVEEQNAKAHHTILEALVESNKHLSRISAGKETRQQPRK